MSIKLTRLAPNTRGIAKLLTLEGVEADISARGLRVADAAEARGIRVEGRPGKVDLPVTVTLASGADRARARVILDHPAGQAVEAKHAVLGAAIDAAGDL